LFTLRYSSREPLDKTTISLYIPTGYSQKIGLLSMPGFWELASNLPFLAKEAQISI
jgi:hypothetical protein